MVKQINAKDGSIYRCKRVLEDETWLYMSGKIELKVKGGFVSFPPDWKVQVLLSNISSVYVMEEK